MTGQVRTVVVKTDRDRPDQIKTGQDFVLTFLHLFNLFDFVQLTQLCTNFLLV